MPSIHISSFMKKKLFEKKQHLGFPDRWIEQIKGQMVKAIAPTVVSVGTKNSKNI